MSYFVAIVGRNYIGKSTILEAPQKIREFQKCGSLFCSLALGMTRKAHCGAVLCLLLDVQLIEYDKESGNLRRGSHCVDL